jgi:hypothetical protein
MMTSTYQAIASTTLSSNAATVTFGSIPGTFTDLVIIGDSTSSSLGAVYMYFNGVTGTTNYSATVLSGNGSSGSSFRSTDTDQALCSVVDTVRSGFIVNIMSYSNTSVFKALISRGGVTTFATRAFAGLWRSTAAITSISIFNGGGNFVSGSTFSIYGIKAES